MKKRIIIGILCLLMIIYTIPAAAKTKIEFPNKISDDSKIKVNAQDYKLYYQWVKYTKIDNNIIEKLENEKVELEKDKEKLVKDKEEIEKEKKEVQNKKTQAENAKTQVANINKSINSKEAEKQTVENGIATCEANINKLSNDYVNIDKSNENTYIDKYCGDNCNRNFNSYENLYVTRQLENVIAEYKSSLNSIHSAISSKQIDCSRYQSSDDNENLAKCQNTLNQLNAAQNSIQSISDIVESYNNNRKYKDAYITSRDRLTNEINNLINERESITIDYSDATIAGYTSQLNNINTQLTAKNTEISNLDTQLTAKNTELNNKKTVNNYDDTKWVKANNDIIKKSDLRADAVLWVKVVENNTPTYESSFYKYNSENDTYKNYGDNTPDGIEGIKNVAGANINLTVGDTFDFTTVFNKENLVWSSTDSTILSIDSNGKATALKSGNVIIYAKNAEYLFSNEVRILEHKKQSDDKKVNIIYDGDAIDDNTNLKNEELDKSSKDYETIKSKLPNADKLTVYDVDLIKENTKVQPNGEIIIEFEIPQGYNPDKIVVYAVNENNNLTKVDHIIVNGKIQIKTTHTGRFAIAEETIKNNEETTKNNNNKEEKNPQTGAIVSISVLAIGIIVAGGIYLYTKKKNKFLKL